MSDRFPPDWFVRQNPWVSWMPDAAPNPAPTSPAAAPTSSMLPASTSDHDGSLSFHHGGFNWMETPNGGLLAVHPNGEGVDWVETPDGGLLAYPKRQVQSPWTPSGIPEHLDSARYWGAAPPPMSVERMPGNGPTLAPVPQAPSWDQVQTHESPGTCRCLRSRRARVPGAHRPPTPTQERLRPLMNFPWFKRRCAPPPSGCGVEGTAPPLCRTSRWHALRKSGLPNPA